MVQILIDGVATNLKFFESLKSYCSQCELPKLISIGSCGLHILYVAFRSGTETTSWQLKVILKSALNLLDESPLRSDDFTSHTENNEYPLFFCARPWVEVTPVAERLLPILSNIVKTIKF